MTDPVPVPEFVERADIALPGLGQEYRALAALALPLIADEQGAGLRQTVLLRCGVAWHYYTRIVLLLAHRSPAEGFVVCRALFEAAIGTLYLLKNPDLLSDFVDHAKLVMYERALAAGIESDVLKPISEECAKISARFSKAKRKPWHRSKLKKMAEVVGLVEFYEIFYPAASGIAHTDAVMLLSHSSMGWKQSLGSLRNERHADQVRYYSLFLTGYLLCETNRDLDLGHSSEANAFDVPITPAGQGCRHAELKASTKRGISPRDW